VDLGLGPNERLGFFVIRFDEVINVFPELGDGREGGACEGLALQN